MNIDDQIVFYDGDCGFCNHIVAFVLKHDKTQEIKFASIQSDFTLKLFEELELQKPDLSTFYFLEDGNMYEKSTAALRLGKYLKFPRSMVGVFWIVPRFIRDAGYNFIAKRRRRLSKGYCVIPNEDQRTRFLSQD
ncbi:MAG: DCC1-like thiol-disulfide oxidoreductase family protein [Crocinitomicaceae bacterium]|nr:DCC1-like thiol-disulfide oxidoreductase family protein [Crocinitomicaceae bacterium]